MTDLRMGHEGSRELFDTLFQVRHRELREREKDGEEGEEGEESSCVPFKEPKRYIMQTLDV